MENDAHAQIRQKRFRALMQAGKQAYDKGDSRAAHDLWREAATLDPYSEKVWLALYRVLTTDEDRIVCLKNIVAINPANTQAQRRLNALMRPQADSAAVHTLLKTVTQERAAVRTQTTESQRVKPPSRLNLARALLIAFVAGGFGVLGGILLSILVYGRG